MLQHLTFSLKFFTALLYLLTAPQLPGAQPGVPQNLGHVTRRRGAGEYNHLLPPTLHSPPPTPRAQLSSQTGLDSDSKGADVDVSPAQRLCGPGRLSRPLTQPPSPGRVPHLSQGPRPLASVGSPFYNRTDAVTSRSLGPKSPFFFHADFI